MPNQPNILLIFTDQHRADTLGCYGSTICTTPHLDALAAQGVVFDRAYTVCPICTPARASLQTGLYPLHHGMTTNTYTPGCMVHELPDVPLLLSRRLQKQGYSLGYTGKWHLGTGNAPEIQVHRQVSLLPMAPPKASLPTSVGYEGDDFPGHGDGGFGFPQFHQYLREAGLELRFKDRAPGEHPRGQAEVISPEESTNEYYLTQRAIHWIDEFHRRGKPFCMQLHYWGPHASYTPPKAWMDRYRDVDIPPWPSFLDDGHDKPSIHNFKRQRRDWASFQESLRYYFAFTSFIDAQIGRLLDHLRTTGQYDNTLILFCADHGESLGIHGGLTDKSIYMFEETVRIPLIVKPPQSLASSRRENRFAVTTNLYETILDYAGDATPQPSDGRSLRPLIEGAAPADWPDVAVTEGSGISPLLFSQRCIHKGDLKYVFNCGDMDELYDLAADPAEMTNLVNTPGRSSDLREMRSALAQWMTQHNDMMIQAFRKLR